MAFSPNSNAISNLLEPLSTKKNMRLKISVEDDKTKCVHVCSGCVSAAETVLTPLVG